MRLFYYKSDSMSMVKNLYYHIADSEFRNNNLPIYLFLEGSDFK